MAKPNTLIMRYCTLYLNSKAVHQFVVMEYDDKLAQVDTFEQADIIREFLESLDVPIKVELLEEDVSNAQQVRGYSIQEVEGV